MTVKSRVALAVTAVFAFGFTPFAATAQSSDVGDKTTPIGTVIAGVAKRTGKKFFVDPRVRAEVLTIQDNLAELSYDDLLTLLDIHGFAAVTTGNYVTVIPSANVRQMALPQAGDEQHPLAEHVTKVVTVKSIPAAFLVPVLRPMLPQHAHMVAMPCTNDLILVDTYGNVQRIERLIKSLDRGAPYSPPKCTAQSYVPPKRLDAETAAREKKDS